MEDPKFWLKVFLLWAAIWAVAVCAITFWYW